MEGELSYVQSIPCPLSLELRPYVEGERTNMRVPVDTLTKVACTLYYLSDEGRLRKTASAFSLSPPAVSVIVRQTCHGISVHLSPKYIGLPFTKPQAQVLVTGFQDAHGMLQCRRAIDETHIKIKQPSTNSMDYINRKGKHS